MWVFPDISKLTSWKVFNVHRFGNLDVKDLDGLKHLESILKAKADSTQDHITNFGPT